MGNANVRQKTAEYQAKYKIGRDEAIEEVLADMAERGVARALTGWEKLVAFIQQRVAAAGTKMGMSLSFTDSMVATLVGAASAIGLQENVRPFTDQVPMASRAPLTIQQSLDTLRSTAATRGVFSTLGSVMQLSGKFNLWNRTVGTQFQKAHQDADFARVFEVVNDQITDTSRYSIEAEQQAPNILQRLETVGDVGKAPLQGRSAHGKDMKPVGQAAFDGIEGVSGVQSRVFTDTELRNQFNLTPRQIALYREFRSTVDTSLNRLAQSFAMKIAGEFVPVRDLA